MKIYAASIWTLSTAFLLWGPLWAQKYKLGDTVSERVKEEKKPASPKKEKFSLKQKKILTFEVAEEFYQKGLQALKEGKLEEAESFFNRTVVLNPGHQKAQEGLQVISRTHEKQESPPKTEDPKVALLQKLSADLDEATQEKKWYEASKIVREILAVEPAHETALQTKVLINKKLFAKFRKNGEAHEKKENPQKAVAAYKKALMFKNSLALAQKIESLEKKIEKANLQQSEAFYIEALKANQDGDTEKAVNFAQKSLDLNPSNFQAERMLQRLQLKH